MIGLLPNLNTNQGNKKIATWQSNDIEQQFKSIIRDTYLHSLKKKQIKTDQLRRFDIQKVLQLPQIFSNFEKGNTDLIKIEMKPKHDKQ